jgi:lipopolysaccharide transport system permease protein
MHSLIEAGSMLQKNPLPPVLFPMRSVLASGLVFGPLMVAVALLYVLAYGAGRTALALPVLWLGQLLLSALLAYALAILAAALRDVTQLVAFVLSVGVYLSPILFPVTLFPEGWRWLLWLNPMTAYVVGYQSVLLYGQWPAAMVWLVAGSWLALVAVVLSVLVRRSRDQLVDWL